MYKYDTIMYYIVFSKLYFKGSSLAGCVLAEASRSGVAASAPLQLPQLLDLEFHALPFGIQVALRRVVASEQLRRAMQGNHRHVVAFNYRGSIKIK